MTLQMGVPVGGFKRLNGSAVTDAVLAAMFVAGRSCGPPNALSSSTLAAIKQKYVDSVCYYAGPIFRSITDNNTVDIPCYNSTFEADIRLVSSSQPSHSNGHPCMSPFHPQHAQIASAEPLLARPIS